METYAHPIYSLFVGRFNNEMNVALCVTTTQHRDDSDGEKLMVDKKIVMVRTYVRMGVPR